MYKIIVVVVVVFQTEQKQKKSSGEVLGAVVSVNYRKVPLS